MEYEGPQRRQVCSLPFADVGDHQRTAIHSVIQGSETEASCQQRIAEELYRFYCDAVKKEAEI